MLEEGGKGGEGAPSSHCGKELWRKREMKRSEKDRDEAIRVEKKQPFIKKERDEEILVKKKKPLARCRER